MKIKINRSRFLTALNTVKDVAGNGGDLMILQNIKMETIGADEMMLTATNLDQTVSTTVKCSIFEPGITTVPAKIIGAMVGALTSEEVEFRHAEGSSDKAVLKGGEVTYKIAVLSPDDFPKNADVKGVDVVFKQTELKDLFRKTAYAASVDGTRRSLLSVCIQTADKQVNAVSTDGRRLALVRVNKDVEPDMEAIIPTVSVKYLQRLLGNDGEVTMSIEKGKAVKFKSDNWTIQTRLLDDMYPNWRMVVPQELATSIALDRSVFAESVRQVSLSSSASNTSICINIKTGVMTLTASTDDVSDAQTMIPVKYEGEDIKSCFNPHYILDVLSAYDEDTVYLNINNGSSPVTITVDGSENVNVIMPLRIN